MGDGTSDKATRPDDFLRGFKPTRITPVDRRFAQSSYLWTDYDFRSEEELARWAELRYAELVATYGDQPGKV